MAAAVGPQLPRHWRDTTRFLPGTIVAGRYRMVSLLGRGGMGEVYRADDLKLGQPVALKSDDSLHSARQPWSRPDVDPELQVIREKNERRR